MAEQFCRVCGSRIRTMAFQGTGACGKRHLDELASRLAARSPHESSLEAQRAQDLRNGLTWTGAWTGDFRIPE